MKPNILIFVLYDGICNSVFEGQVLQPLLNKKQENPSLDIHIVSYEYKKPNNNVYARLASYGITLHILKKKNFFIYPLITYLTFTHELKKLLSCFSAYELIARGPLAAYFCVHTITTNCKKLTIQVRGLLAQEHNYVHQNEKNSMLRVLYWLRTCQLEHLEKSVYQFHIPYTIDYALEAVSPALKKYLITTYGTQPEKISVACDDIPKILPIPKVHNWKKTTRAKLNIPEHAYVYCYNGSAKPWQCPEKIINFFDERITSQRKKQNKDLLLLVLTQDTKTFLKLLRQKKIPETTYRVVSVPHEDIYAYLAAANAGILFRKKHIINWVSRPTKLLEYNAVGLKLIHNNTVAYAQNKSQYL